MAYPSIYVTTFGDIDIRLSFELSNARLIAHCNRTEAILKNVTTSSGDHSCRINIPIPINTSYSWK